MSSCYSTRRMRTRSTSLCYRPFLCVLEDRTLPGFLAPLSVAVGTGPESVAVGDFDGDGTLDLAVGTSQGLSVLLGNGDGTFRAAVNYVGSGFGSVVVGDFDRDGILDLAGLSGPGVSVLLGNGDG